MITFTSQIAVIVLSYLPQRHLNITWRSSAIFEPSEPVTYLLSTFGNLDFYQKSSEPLVTDSIVYNYFVYIY